MLVPYTSVNHCRFYCSNTVPMVEMESDRYHWQIKGLAEGTAATPFSVKFFITCKEFSVK